jgi:hypothetical protein
MYWTFAFRNKVDKCTYETPIWSTHIFWMRNLRLLCSSQTQRVFLHVEHVNESATATHIWEETLWSPEPFGNLYSAGLYISTPVIYYLNCWKVSYSWHFIEFCITGPKFFEMKFSRSVVGLRRTHTHKIKRSIDIRKELNISNLG